MHRYLAGFLGLFLFSTTSLAGCAADASDETTSTQESSQSSPDVTLKAGELPSSFAGNGPACLPGKYSSGWTTIELLPEGRGLRAERLHDGRKALDAQSGITWSATDRTITIGLEEQSLRAMADCRFVWIGESMFVRQPR